MSDKLIGVTGPGGRLGTQLVLAGITPIAGDIRNRAEMTRACAGFDVIINAAAYTDVDGAESEDELVQEEVVTTNVRGPGILRQSFEGVLIHVSTGFVFDGIDGPYSENAVPNPVNFYGLSKLGGEMGALMRSPSLVARTLDLFGPGDTAGLVASTISKLKANQTVGLSTRHLVTPTYTPHLAEALIWLANWNTGGYPKIVNVCGNRVFTRYEWGRQIAVAFGLDPTLIQIDDKPWGKAERPYHGGLRTEFAEGLGVPIQAPWNGLIALKRAYDDV